jgi:hypothetical protein
MLAYCGTNLDLESFSFSPEIFCISKVSEIFCISKVSPQCQCHFLKASPPPILWLKILVHRYKKFEKITVTAKEKRAKKIGQPNSG